MRRLQVVPSTPPRATIYLRQSTYRDESISLELQEIACRDYCDRMGYTVVAVESDPGVSGRTWKRPAVQRTMQAIEDRETDIVILWKWSRLSRSRKDWALAIDRADLAGGRIESATEPIDTATASGRFARGVMTEYAAFQSEQIGETWEEVRQRRLSRGLPASGRLPYGWRWIKGEGIEQNPEQAPVVIEMYRRYLSGDGSATIAQWLNSQGILGPNGSPWTRVRPLTVMNSPIHAGLIPYRGNTYPGAHEAIIDEATFRAYQSERQTRREVGVKPRTSDYLLSTLVRCECGAKMSGKGSVTGGHWYGGYICSDTLNGHPLRAYVSTRLLDPAISTWFMTFDPQLPPARRRQETVERAKVDAARRDLDELEGELAKAGRQNLRGILPDSTFMRIRSELESEMGPLQQVVADAARAKPRPSVDQLRSLRALWPRMITSERNQTLRQIIDRVDIRDSGKEARIRTVWGDSSAVPL